MVVQAAGEEGTDFPAAAAFMADEARLARAALGPGRPVGASAVLVLLGDEGLDITRLHRESRSVVDNIEKLLALRQRAAAD
jgi:hypothetical protein